MAWQECVALGGQGQEVLHVWGVDTGEVEVERDTRDALANRPDDLALPARRQPADVDRPTRAQTRQLLGHWIQVGAGSAVVMSNRPNAAGVDPGAREFEDQTGGEIRADDGTDRGIDAHQPGTDGGCQGGTIGAGTRIRPERGITVDRQAANGDDSTRRLRHPLSRAIIEAQPRANK